jgi:Ca2+-binding EF-hand superfamily protein
MQSEKWASVSDDDEFLHKIKSSYGQRLLASAQIKVGDLAHAARARAEGPAGATATPTAAASVASTMASGNNKRAHVKDRERMMESINTVKSLKAIFDEYDKDGDGSISLSELYTSINSWDTSMTGMVSAMFGQMDTDNSGRISFPEMLARLYPQASATQVKRMAEKVGIVFADTVPPPPPRLTLTPAQVEEVLEIFKLYDTDSNGTISLAELTEAMKPMGFKKEEVIEVFDKFDVNHDRQLSPEEFELLFIESWGTPVQHQK